jgi:hypothetical protein
MVNVLPPARLALDGDVATHHPAEPPAQRQAETGAAIPARRGRVGLGKRLEQPRELLGRHADARIAHAEHDPGLTIDGFPGHRQRDRPSFGELAGVAQEVEEGLAHLRQIRPHRADLVGAPHVQTVGVLRGQRLDHGGDVVGQAGDVEALEVQLHLAGLDLGEVEHGVDQLQQVLAGRVDLSEIVGELLGSEIGGVLLEHLAVADDRVERRAQLVRHVGQELRLVAVGGLELAALVLDLPEQPRVLDGQRRLAGEGLEDIDDLRGKFAGRLLGDGEAADEVILTQQRNAQEGPRSRLQQDIAERAAVRPRLGDVGDLDRLERHGHAPGDALAPPDRRPPSHVDHFVREIVGGAEEELLGALVVLVDGARFGAGELVGARDDGAEHGLEVERGAERLADLAEGLQLLDRAGELGRAGLQLAQQSRVLDGDGRLVGEGSPSERSGCR